jgi:DNA polymerase-3 subunit gamma/tau
MSYQVIARKYRPQRFDEVVGQEHITKTLQNAIDSKRIHHAYLFTGARGIGKTTVARILAKALNCEKGPLAEPCGKCSPCMEITAGNSLDVQEIDGASNTGVDDIREIRDRTKYMPAGGRYKIYIIDEVHMLSTAAFNALLKTLEEPPPHVIFIFATTEAHKIPATILSRCQRYDFRRIPVSKIVESLKKIAKDESVTPDDESLSLIAREATGSMRDAQSLLDQAIAFSGKTVGAPQIKAMLGFLDRKLLFDLLEAVFAKDAKKSLSILDEIFDMGADLSRFALDFLSCLRHILVIKECGFEKNLLDVPQDEAEILNRLASGSAPEDLHQMFQVWYAAADSIARSPFPKMLLEVLLMRLARIEPVRSIADLMEEIEALTARGNSEEGKQTRTVPPLCPPKAGPPLADKGREGGVDLPPPAPPYKGGDWDSFIKWLTVDRPQIASIFQHGTVDNISGDVVRLNFDNPFYADMLLEADRKTQVEELFKNFFKTKMRLEIRKVDGAQKANGTPPATQAQPVQPVGRASVQERKKALTKEALETEIVKEAAEILNARVHDVRVGEDE